jgi:transcriptional regulator with XRE-family HTH domain
VTETSKHLADRIEARRKELRLSPTQLGERTGLSLQALKNIRQGQVRAYQERLTGPLTSALGWTPDSIERLLRGEEPVLAETPSPSTPPTPEELQLMRSALNEAIEKLDKRVAALEAALIAGQGHRGATDGRSRRAGV